MWKKRNACESEVWGTHHRHSADGIADPLHISMNVCILSVTKECI
jgi:hypothetical protein